MSRRNPEAFISTPEDPHPWYGPCDGFGDNGACAECEEIERQPTDPRVAEALDRMKLRFRELVGGERSQIYDMLLLAVAEEMVREKR